jgi:hypothetical protein
MAIPKTGAWVSLSQLFCRCILPGLWNASRGIAKSPQAATENDPRDRGDLSA